MQRGRRGPFAPLRAATVVPLIAQSVQSAACQTGLRVRRRGESAAAEHKGGETPGSVLGGLISGGMSTPVGSASNRHHGERILVDDPEHPASRASAQTAVIQKDEGRESVSSPFQATRLVSPPPTSLPKRPQSAPDSSYIPVKVDSLRAGCKACTGC